MLVTLTVVVRLTTTLFTTRGPPQPPHQATPTNPGRPHQGMTGSPQPSGAQCTGRAATTTGPPRKPTSAGAYTGRTTTGPGAQPHGAASSQVQPKRGSQIHRPVLYGTHPGGTLAGAHTGPYVSSVRQVPCWASSSVPYMPGETFCTFVGWIR